MLDRFMKLIAEKQLLQPGEKLLVAFSSGPDSLALLYLLLLGRAYPGAGWQIAVGHLDHRQQANSYREAEQVRCICEQLGIPCYQGKEDVIALAKRRKLGLEEAGRAARYRFLRQQAEAFGATAILFGHQADDQLEQFWLRLLRGTSPGSLAGIPETRRLAPGIRAVRPLLPFSREEIDAFLETVQNSGVFPLNITPVQDPDNSDLRFERNRLRIEMLPYLDARYPDWRRRTLGLMRILAEDEAFLQDEVSHKISQGSWRMGMYRFPQDLLLEMHPALQKRLILRVFSAWPQETGEEAIQGKHLQWVERSLASLKPGQRLDLPAGRCLQFGGGYLYWQKNWPPKDWEIPVEHCHDRLRYEQSLPWASSPAEVGISFTKLSKPAGGWPRADDRCYIASRWAKFPWRLRSPLPGDGLITRSHRKKTGELLRERGIPIPERLVYPILCIGEQTAALVGITADEMFLATDDDTEAIAVGITWKQQDFSEPI